MALAVFEAYFSRPIAPTRRLALGDMELPTNPSPGYGGVLLGAIMARFARDLDEETDEGIDQLVDELEAGERVAQPRLRHRLQADRIGLTRCRHTLDGDGEKFQFRFDERGSSPTQNVIAAAYASASVPTNDRQALFNCIRKGLDWIGPIDESLVRFLSDRRSLGAAVGSDPEGWAMDRLALSGTLQSESLHDAVAQAFRANLLQVHPDHGGSAEHAAEAIAELREARRILLGR